MDRQTKGRRQGGASWVTAGQAAKRVQTSEDGAVQTGGMAQERTAKKRAGARPGFWARAQALARWMDAQEEG